MAWSTDRLIKPETPSCTTVLPQDQTPLAPTCAPEAQPTAQATTSPRLATMSRSASQESLALRCLVHQVVNTKKTVTQVLGLPRNKRFKGDKGVSRANLYRAVEKMKRAELAAAGTGTDTGTGGSTGGNGTSTGNGTGKTRSKKEIKKTSAPYVAAENRTATRGRRTGPELPGRVR